MWRYLQMPIDFYVNDFYCTMTCAQSVKDHELKSKNLVEILYSDAVQKQCCQSGSYS